MPVAGAGRAVAFDAPGLAIRGRYHPPEGQAPRRLWVVIEGDGAAWRNGIAPADPTPRRPVGPSVLAVLPETDGRLWLARPCQFLTPAELRDCAPRHWTGGRFAPEILDAYDRMIDAEARGAPVVLVGFSGGGVIAADLALRRADVAGLATLAAPLDLEAWTAHHGVPPLDEAQPSGQRLRGLAQSGLPAIHLFGGSDRVVPPAMLGRTQAMLQGVETVPGAGHDADWAAILAPRLEAFSR